MRLRNDPNAINILNQNPYYYVNNPIANKSNWNNYFNNNNKQLHIEVGMGKGNFIIEKALANPEINFIGIEKNIVVSSIAIKKILKKEKQINNLKILNVNAQNLIDIFDKGEVDKIYLNFSDPWPKKRHAKNRLTNPKFLVLYKTILFCNGYIEFKTDNIGLYQYSLDIFNSLDWVNLIYYSPNIYDDLENQYNVNNIQTEYEKKFINKGETIKKIIFNF